MAELSTEIALCRQVSKAVGNQQFGLVTARQLRRRGVSYPAIRSALKAERLFEVHRGIYSLVPVEHMSVHSRHYAAVLAGGKGAALFGESATWWLGLTPSMPSLIHIATHRPRTPANGIRWHVVRLRLTDTFIHNRMRVTAPRRTALDYAATHSLWDTKGVLAELEYRWAVDATELSTRRGHPGSKRLRQAIEDHTPQLAKTHEESERAFLRFLDDRSLELPDANVSYGPTHVDFAYPHLNLIVEIDDVRGHSGDRRILRDHRRDLHRRREGQTTLRYFSHQFATEPDLVEADLLAHGVREVARPRRHRQSRK